MRTVRMVLMLAAAALLLPLPARAHHSFAAEYDANATILPEAIAA